MTTNLSTLEQLATTADKNTKGRFAEQSAEGIVNPIVLAALVGVRPQMIYNYIRKGKFTQPELDSETGSNSTQKIVLDLREANTWATAYLEKKQAKADKVAAELEEVVAE